MAVSNYNQAYAWVSYILAFNQLRDGFEKHCVVLHFADTANYADNKFVSRNSVFPPQTAISLLDLIRIHAQWDHSKLICSANIEAFRNLTTLLFANGDNCIGTKPCKKPLDGQEDFCLRSAKVAVKHVAVIGVNDSTPARAEPQSRRGQPFVEFGRDATSRSCLCLLGIDYLRMQFPEISQQFPDDD